MADNKLFKLRKDDTKITGVAVLGNGTVRHSDAAGQTARPRGSVRSGKVAILTIEERLTFQLEEATTANVPAMGTKGATEWTSDELTGGLSKDIGIKGAAALSTVMSVDKTWNDQGVPVIEVVVEVHSTDEDSGVVYSAGSDPNA